MSELIQHVLKFVPKGADVIEIGSGKGALGGELKAAGFTNITGIDCDAEMIKVAEGTGAYGKLVKADLTYPVDTMGSSVTDAAIAIDFFTAANKAPAVCAEELIHLVKAGGHVVFDHSAADWAALGLEAKCAEKEDGKAWKLVDKADIGDKTLRVYQVLETKSEPVPKELEDQLRDQMPRSPTKRLDNRWLYDGSGSRLFQLYLNQHADVDKGGFYVTPLEIEMMQKDGDEMTKGFQYLVELGCGSADKANELLAHIVKRDGHATYIGCDVSAEAAKWTADDVTAKFGDKVDCKHMIGLFDDVMPKLNADLAVTDVPKLWLFLGQTIGNFYKMEDCRQFLLSVRKSMGPKDKFLLSWDLHKEEEILINAYTGSYYQDFARSTPRRLNRDMGANFDLTSLELKTTYEDDVEYPLMKTRTKALQVRLVNTKPDYKIKLDGLGEYELKQGEQVQVGISRKVTKENMDEFLPLAGFTFEKHFVDKRNWVSLNVLGLGDIPAADQ